MRADRNSFNGGELTNWLDSRSDLYKRASGCRTLENCHIVRYGGARRRSGFLLAGSAAAANVRLEGFNFSRETGYVLEFSNAKMRVWNRDGSQVMDGGSPFELATPFLEAELFLLDFAQKNDVIVITHPNHHPQILQHLGADDWTIGDIPWRVRPWSDWNDTDTEVTLTKPGTEYTGTFSESLVTADWLDSYLRIRRPVSSQILQTSFFDVSDPPDLPPEYSWEDFVPTNDYDPDPATAGNKSTVLFRNGLAVDHHTLWRCISSHTGAAGSSDPADYPTEFAQGIIALDGILVTGRWEFETKGTWTGTWKVERSYNEGNSWEEVATVYSDADSNSLIAEEESPTRPALYRVLAWSVDNARRDNVYFRVLEGEVVSEFLITLVLSSTEVYLDPITPEAYLELGEASLDWSLDAFSQLNGYPAVTTFHESRLFFAATTAEPERIWASRTEAFFNFSFGTESADAFSFVLNANRYNEIVWLCSQQALLIGTTGAEWSSFTTEGGPMTPENTNFHLHTHHGSEANPGLVLSDAAVFVQRQGRKIREFAPSPQGLGGAYSSPDLTELAEHITRSGIKQLAKRDSPDTELFALRNDGTLAAMIFERSQQIYAWSRWTTPGGLFKSIATTYGAGEDDAVFVAVERTIAGVTSTFIEYLSPDGIRAEEDPDASAFVSVDHAQRASSLTAAYAGEEIDAQDGFKDLGTFTVGAGGSVALPGGEINPVLGYAFTSEIEPMPVEAGGYANKTAHQSAHIRVKDSSSFQIGSNARDRFNTISITPDDALPVNMDKVLAVPGRFERNSSVVIRKDRPGPLSVISIDLETQTGTR